MLSIQIVISLDFIKNVSEKTHTDDKSKNKFTKYLIPKN